LKKHHVTKVEDKQDREKEKSNTFSMLVAESFAVKNIDFLQIFDAMEENNR